MLFFVPETTRSHTRRNWLYARRFRPSLSIGRCLCLAFFFLPEVVAATSMNISQFVFRDVNRNGVYDRGEQPFAGVTIRLEQEGRTPIDRESNLSGFANFPMSSDDEGKDITAEGAVRFVVEVPDGMKITTGNPVQSAAILSTLAAPGGFAMYPPNPFVGLAPDLTISSNATGLVGMDCRRGGKVVAAVMRGKNLVCTVEGGSWTVHWKMSNGTVMSRGIAVDHWPIHVAPGNRPEADVSAGSVVNFTFDDYLRSQNILELPSSDGFEFHNFIVTHHKYYGGWGYVNGTVSGEFAVYTSSGHPATISSPSPFGFVRAFVSVAWPDAMQAPVRFTAFRKGKIVASETLMASNLAPILFAADWYNIDEVVVSHDTFWQVVIDDMVLAQ